MANLIHVGWLKFRQLTWKPGIIRTTVPKSCRRVTDLVILVLHIRLGGWPAHFDCTPSSLIRPAYVLS